MIILHTVFYIGPYFIRDDFVDSNNFRTEIKTNSVYIVVMKSRRHFPTEIRWEFNLSCLQAIIPFLSPSEICFSLQIIAAVDVISGKQI